MNDRIKMEAKAKGVRLWEIAEALGVSEFTFSRRLRHELSPQDKKTVLAVIKAISARRGR